MDEASAQALAELVRAQPVAALGTLHATHDGVEPFVSMTPVAWLAGAPPQAVIHVSALAPHTRDLRGCAQVSLMLTAPPGPDDDPQARARLTVQAQARFLERDSGAWTQARDAYLARFPRAVQTFALGDFQLVALQARSARFVAGFGRAHGLTADALAQVLAAS